MEVLACFRPCFFIIFWHGNDIWSVLLKLKGHSCCVPRKKCLSDSKTSVECPCPLKQALGPGLRCRLAVDCALAALPRTTLALGFPYSLIIPTTEAVWQIQWGRRYCGLGNCLVQESIPKTQPRFLYRHLWTFFFFEELKEGILLFFSTWYKFYFFFKYIFRQVLFLNLSWGFEKDVNIYTVLISNRPCGFFLSDVFDNLITSYFHVNGSIGIVQKIEFEIRPDLGCTTSKTSKKVVLDNPFVCVCLSVYLSVLL